jgi:hypothetical protein
MIYLRIWTKPRVRHFIVAINEGRDGPAAQKRALSDNGRETGFPETGHSRSEALRPGVADLTTALRGPERRSEWGQFPPTRT